MTFLLRTLSWSYAARHPGKTLLAIAGIAVGVATFVAVRAAQQTLVAGFQTTIDRLSGHTDLEITGADGVPEPLREQIRGLRGIDAEQPVIEQTVRAATRVPVSLLIVGVDLVGDGDIRDYSFSGDDTDVDDPIVFLAQPDSIALTREFTERNGLAKGDALNIQVSGVTRRLRIRALLEPSGFARAYGGNIGVVDVYAAEDLFGRGRRFDRLEIRIGLDAARGDVVTRLRQAVGPGYTIEPPEQRAAGLQRVAATFVTAFDASSALCLAISLFLIYNIFTIAVQRRRRDIGIMRSIGATPLQMASTFLCEAAVLGVIGGAAGVVLGSAIAGWSFSAMNTAMAATEGLQQTGVPSITPALVAQGILGGLLASVAGAWLPAQQAARVPPVESLASGVFAASAVPIWQQRDTIGLTLLGGAYVTGRYGALPPRYVLPVVAVAGAIGVVVLSGRVARLLVAGLAPLLARIAPAAGRVAADALLGHPRRTSAAAAILTISATLVLGLAGYLSAVHAAFERWTNNVITADLIVQASPGFGPSLLRLPADIGHVLSGTPGVIAADGFRNERVVFRGDPIALVALDSDGFAKRTRHVFTAGDDRAFSDALPHGACVVSDNFARQYHVAVGGSVDLDSPSGPVHLPVAAVVEDYISNRGTVMIDRSTFRQRWRDDRVDAFHLSLAGDADAAGVAREIGVRLGGRTPALVLTRAAFVGEMEHALDSLYVMIRSTEIVSLIVALLAIGSALLVSVAERSRDIAVLRALGADARQIVGAVALEALTLAVVSLAIATPLGNLLAWLLRARVSESLAGFHFPPAYPYPVLAGLLLALPIVALVATWVPARWATTLDVREAMACE